MKVYLRIYIAFVNFYLDLIVNINLIYLLFSVEIFFIGGNTNIEIDYMSILLKILDDHKQLILKLSVPRAIY